MLSSQTLKIRTNTMRGYRGDITTLLSGIQFVHPAGNMRLLTEVSSFKPSSFLHSYTAVAHHASVRQQPRPLNRLSPGMPASTATHEVGRGTKSPPEPRHRRPSPHYHHESAAGPCHWHMSTMSTMSAGNSVSLARRPSVISMSSTASVGTPSPPPPTTTPVAPACRASPVVRKLPRPLSPAFLTSGPSFSPAPGHPVLLDADYTTGFRAGP